MFTPWVGQEFGNPENNLGLKRILVLGESHHSDQHELGALVPNMTTDVFQWYLQGPWAPWMRTFDNAAAAVAGQSKRVLGRSGVNAVWNQMAFYNYVPVVAAPGSRHRPPAEYFDRGVEPFRSVLETLRPGAIIVCGYELWARIIPHHTEAYVDNPWRPSSPFAQIGSLKIPALRMVHPSTAFSPAQWTPRIQDLFSRVPVGDRR